MNSNDQSYVYPKFLRVGLGDMLFVWARATIFAQLNDLPMLAPRWMHFRRDGLLAFNGAKLDVSGEINFPHSLGLFYTAVTQWLGFPKYGDEGKVMGLAPLGRPIHLDTIVCTPDEAISVFTRARMDALAIGGYLVTK